MKQACIAQVGGPDVLQIVDADPPKARDDVVVGLETAAINWVDVLTRSGTPPLVLGRWRGRRSARLGSGGRPGFYAQQVAVATHNLVRVPAAVSFAHAAALPTA